MIKFEVVQKKYFRENMGNYIEILTKKIIFLAKTIKNNVL